MHIIFRMKGHRSRSHGLFKFFTLSAQRFPPYLTKSLHMWHTYNTWWSDVSRTIFCHLSALWLHAYLTGLSWLRVATSVRTLDLLVWLWIGWFTNDEWHRKSLGNHPTRDQKLLFLATYVILSIICFFPRLEYRENDENCPWLIACSLLFTVGQLIAFLWQHANIYCGFNFTNCPENVSKLVGLLPSCSWLSPIDASVTPHSRAPYGLFPGPVRPHTTPVRDFCQLWLCQFPYVPVRAPYGALAGPTRAPYGSRRIWRTFEIPVRGPYDARTGTARGPCGVLRFIWSKHKCTAVSSRTGPVAWCDHENNAGVKILRALHPALRARNRTGVKNRMGSVVGCDWGITHLPLAPHICVGESGQHWFR